MSSNDVRVQIGTAFPGMTFPDEVQDGSSLGSATYKEFQFLYSQLEGFLRAAGFNPDGTFNNLVANSVTLVSNYNTVLPPTVGTNQPPGTIYTVSNNGTASQIMTCCPDAAGVGALCITFYGDDPFKFYSPAGVDLGSIPNQTKADQLTSAFSPRAQANGDIVIVGAPYGTAFVAPDFSSIGYPSDATILNFGIGFDATGNIYSSRSGGAAGVRYIRKVTSAGVFVADYQLDDWDTVLAVGVNSAGTKIYYSATNVFNSDPAKRKTNKQVYVYDVAGATITLFTSEASYSCGFNSIMVVPYTGDVLVAWDGAGLTGYVKHYNSSGTLLYTYAPTMNGYPLSPFYITPGLTDFSFWINAGANVDTYSGCALAEIQMVTGSVLNQFAPEDGTLNFYCPFFVLRDAIPQP